MRTFIVGAPDIAPAKPAKGKKATAEPVAIRRKFHGDDAMIDPRDRHPDEQPRTAARRRAGTAKSMLSELLAAAISGTSALTIQGTAGTTEDQIKYSWNYALLLAEGPSPKALVPAPLYRGLSDGQLVRFEEITRCPPEIQDTLISVLSDKVLHVPELTGESSILFAKPGFNVIATANTRDRGVHEMSAALKRRFNFETVHPIQEKQHELTLVMEQTSDLLIHAGATANVEQDVIDVLVTTFGDLRRGRTDEGTVVEKPSTAMSTAEAVAVAFAASLDAAYFGDGKVRGDHLARQIVGTVLKDSADDAKKIRQYFEVVVKHRAPPERALEVVLRSPRDAGCVVKCHRRAGPVMALVQRGKQLTTLSGGNAFTGHHWAPRAWAAARSSASRLAQKVRHQLVAVDELQRRGCGREFVVGLRGVRRDPRSAQGEGDESVAVRLRAQERGVVGRDEQPVLAVPLQPAQERADDVLIDLLQRRDLGLHVPFVRSLIGRLDVDDDEVDFIEGLDGVPALGGVVGVEVAGGARHGDVLPAQKRRQAAKQVDGRDHRALHAEAALKVLQRRTFPQAPQPDVAGGVFAPGPWFSGVSRQTGTLWSINCRRKSLPGPEGRCGSTGRSGMSCGGVERVSAEKGAGSVNGR